MQLRSLGRSEISIPPLFLGTWAIGGWMWGGTDEKKAIEAIQSSIENGMSAIDTAPIYGMGFSEEMVGKAIAGQRDKVFLATKCGLRWQGKEAFFPEEDFKTSDLKITNNLKPKSILFECEQSLKRLKVEAIDLYQIHWPDSETPLEESWSAMAELKKQGKVRAIGVCNYDLEQIRAIHAIHPVDSVQLPYSLIRRSIEKEIIPFCTASRIAVIVYSPMERGLLTGKYKGKPSFPKGDHRSDKETFSPDFLAKIEKCLEKIRPIAEKHRATLAQLIVNCTIHRPGITVALVGARDAAQAKENAKAGNLRLSEEEYAFIAETFSAPELQRPLREF